MAELYILGRFLPALPEQVAPQQLPRIPEWWPLPPKDGSDEPPLGPAERAHARRARAMQEACTGPLDGQRHQLRRVGPDGPPPGQVLLYDNTVVYVLDEALSTEKVATYRYSPALSHIHQGAMKAVEEAFAEYGQTYAQEARHDDTDQLGYPERHSLTS